MPHTYINEKVNINQYPELDVKNLAANGNQISLGDLHGSALKLLYTLVRHGFMQISKADYEKFSALYYQETPYTKQDIDSIKRLFARAQIISAAQNASLMLIGDILADRGKNDYFTLLLLKKLRDNNIPFQILTSNHDAEFTRLYEQRFNANEKKSRFDESMLGPQAQSAANLQELINKGFVSHEEIAELVEDSYKPALKPLSYSLDKDTNKITIYSHGKISLENIKNMAEQLNTTFYGIEPAEIAKTIDQINVEFAKYVRSNRVSDLINIEALSADEINNSLMDAKKFPFAHLIWNRNADNLNRNIANVYFVHGHDSKDPTAGNVYNLDNTLSKLPQTTYATGIYNVLCTSGINLQLSLNLPVKHKASLDAQHLVDDFKTEWTDLSSSQIDLTQSIILDQAPSSVSSSGYFNSFLNWMSKSPTKETKQSVVAKIQETPTLTNNFDLSQSVVFDDYKEPAKSYDSTEKAPSIICRAKNGERLTGAFDMNQSMIFDTTDNEKAPDTYETVAEEGMVYLSKYGEALTGPVDMTKSFRYVKRDEIEQATTNARTIIRI